MTDRQKLNLVISNEAKNDLIQIISFIKKDNIKAARNVITLLQKSCEILALFPNMGSNNPKIKLEDAKILIIKWQYVIVYKIENNDLVILKFLSKYQDICNLL